MQNSTIRSYWPHGLVIASIIVVGLVIYVQWQNQSEKSNRNQPEQLVTDQKSVLPANKTQAEIEKTVYALQAQPTTAPAQVVLYTGPTDYLKNITMRQNDILAITNASPNEVLVSFSSGSSMTLGANSTLENTLSTIGDEIISITEGADTTGFVVTVKPKL